MDNGNSAAHQVREAAERIRQEQQAWQGVGLMAVENLDTGACSVLLVPSDAPCPNWLRDGKGLGWDRHEDMDLLTRLPRWYRSLSAQPDGRWSEWQNMLRIRCHDALVAQLPTPTRLLQVRHGFGAYLVPMSATTPTLLGRLLAWLLPWERLAVTFTAGDGTDLPGVACTTWACQEGVVPSWPPSSGLGGAAGRTWEERVTSGGTREWGVVVAWPRAVDAVVAFLVAQADAMEQPASTVRAGAVSGKRWEDVQAELEARMKRDRQEGKPCPSFRELGEALNCSHHTVSKAFEAHVGLTAWRKETEAGAARTTPAAAQVLPADTDEAVRALVREQAADFEPSPLKPGPNPRVRKQA